MAVRPYGDHRDALTDEQLADIERVVAALPPLPEEKWAELGRLFGGTFYPRTVAPAAHSSAHSQPETHATHETHATP